MKEVTNTYLQFVKHLEDAGLDLKGFKILLTVAKYEGRGVLELAKKAGISKSVFSRYVNVLAGGAPNAIPQNKALVSMSAVDHKTKALSLTETGRSLLNTLGEFLPQES